ncbi:M10 family metallopeptidase C-terminal domain-containing protein [Sphingomonas sp.]|uniref:M10 family metallopeptidase C-terminal domain-containing protein n=1 Tax=Sphingomonas sp. TaxID=28214 RepID=UPI003B0088F7
MSDPTADQANEITYISGVTGQGTVASQAFASWNGDTPATYSTFSYQAKWGPASAGAGATVSYAFAAASNWSAAEKQAFATAMHLWSDVANISFVEAGATSAQLTLTRAHDGTASGGINRLYPGAEGSATLGTAIKAAVAIDTSVAGFGPIGGSASAYGGYPWMTLEHEIGHAIGLGHAGAYDEDGRTTDDYAVNGGYDSRLYSIMSYHDVSSVRIYPTTPMLLDVAAAQRLYGLPASSPLSSGGQVFGFHSNIQGDTAAFYDFSVNTTPYITIWDGGSNNTLDLSGFSVGSTVSLVDGTLNSVGTYYQNLGIAYGTRIDTVIGGSGGDRLSANANSDVVMGGSAADTLVGGTGNDHIYGNTSMSVQGSTDGGDDIQTGGGNDYVNGNAGDDIITAASGDNRLYGGAGRDRIIASNGNNHINGNLGEDYIEVHTGNNVIFGGQGNDSIELFDGNNVVSGDAGDDHIRAQSGFAIMTGGPGSDSFLFSQSPVDRPGALAGYIDEITDFMPGADRINIGGKSLTLLHDANGTVFSTVADARADAQALISGHAGLLEAAAVQVGSDTYLFWGNDFRGEVVDSAVRIDHVSAGDFTQASLSTSY